MCGLGELRTPARDKGFDALQNVFIALQKLANRTKKKQLKKCVKILIKQKIYF
jgi:hypothetical protein